MVWKAGLPPLVNLLNSSFGLKILGKKRNKKGGTARLPDLEIIPNLSQALGAGFPAADVFDLFSCKSVDRQTKRS